MSPPPPQSYPVCRGAPPAPAPSRLCEAPDHKRSRNHRTLSDRETGSRAPGGTHVHRVLFTVTIKRVTAKK